MDTSIKLTIFFEGAFWVGVFERTYDTSYEAAKVVFGSEPKDYEVYDFILSNFFNLKFGSSLEVEKVENIKINPKRRQREIRKETQNKGLGTKAQLAVKLQYEEKKKEIRQLTKEQKQAQKEKRFEQQQQKKLEKHKGH